MRSASNCSLSPNLLVQCFVAFLIIVTPYYYFNVNQDPYASTPFCDVDGTCHEKPDKPSPRTIYSARSQQQYDLWWEIQAKLNASAQSYANRRVWMKKGGDVTDSATTTTTTTTRPLILLGDSITESWIGTDMGKKVMRADGVPQVLTELLEQSARNAQLTWDPLVLGMGGDQTQHLLYRLTHGQLLPAYANDPTAVFVVLIGTNNLGSGELFAPTAQGVLAVADYLLTHTKGYLVLLHILPRGDSFRLPRICPPRCNSLGRPFSSFLPAVKNLNRAIGQGLDQLLQQQQQQQHDSKRVKWLDCGKPFLMGNTTSSTTEEVVLSLMPDRIHPNAAGHRLLGDCFLKHIKQMAGK